jgi:ABC-type amino acid transport substrate-binding protein
METSHAHLKGKIIGVQLGTVHVRFAEQYYGATSTIKIYQTQDVANQRMILNSRQDSMRRCSADP